MKVQYEQQGDYLIPCVTTKEQKEIHLGVWANRHRQYLKQSHKVRYYNLLTSEKLYDYLADVEEQAENMFLRLVNADYIVMKKDGTIWVIETKGGESNGKDKNIDRQIKNKFYAFKKYAAENNLNWGFVRDKDNFLYINNTEFAIDMADDHWQPIDDVF